MKTYTLTYVRQIVGICYMTQGTQTRPLWQPRVGGWSGRWEGGSRGRGHMYASVWFMLMCDRNQHTIVKQLSSNLKKFSSVQSVSRVQLFSSPWTAACQASLSITNSWSLLKLMSIKSVMPSNHLILCHPLLLLPSIFPSIRIFSWVSSSHQVAKVLEFQLQHQSFQWMFRTDFL